MFNDYIKECSTKDGLTDFYAKIVLSLRAAPQNAPLIEVFSLNGGSQENLRTNLGPPMVPP